MKNKRLRSRAIQNASHILGTLSNRDSPSGTKGVSNTNNNWRYKLKTHNWIISIIVVIVLSLFGISCGTDSDDQKVDLPENELDTLYKELTGTYVLNKIELILPENPEFEPDPEEDLVRSDIEGAMVITADQVMKQRTEQFDTDFSDLLNSDLSFHILIDEQVFVLSEVTEEFQSIALKMKYTWDGEVLKLSLVLQEYIYFESVYFHLNQYWQKKSDTIEDLPPITEDEPSEPPTVGLDAFFISATPASGSELAANDIITITFDNNPGIVTASIGEVSGSGRSRKIRGDFPLGDLTITIAWTAGDGSITLSYTVIPSDNTPPSVISSRPEDGSEDIDPGALFDEGIIVTFNEPIFGDLMLLDGGDEIFWESITDGNTITLFGLAGGELANETEYQITGTVADRAGNETEVSITFVTAAKE